MKEVKTPKKPLIFYYAVAMLAVFLFNFFAMPWLAQHQIKEVDYNTFVEMVEQDKVGKVEIQEQDNRILFTDKDETQVYKTGLMNDPELTQRLYDAGAQFSIIFFVVKIFGIHAGIFFAVQNIGKGHPLQLPFLTNRRGQVGGCVRQDKITHVRAHLP